MKTLFGETKVSPFFLYSQIIEMSPNLGSVWKWTSYSTEIINHAIITIEVI